MKRQFELSALKSAFFVSILSVAITIATSSFSFAVDVKGDPNKTPYELQDVGVKEHLGEKVDLDLQFINSTDNQKHSLREYVQNGKPTILNLVYYECPMLCTMVLNGVTDGMKGMDWSVGNQFNVVTISINPKDDSGDADAKKSVYLDHYVKAAEGAKSNHSRDQAKTGWQFFTSDEVTVKKLADQLGFQYTYDKQQGQYAHAAVTFVLSPDGMISRNLYGVQYRPRDLRLALLEASRGKVGNVFDRLLMFCYHYEPGARGYSLQAVRVMQLGALATIGILGGYIAVFFLRQNRKKGLVERKDPVS